jgi:PAS domain S-box-containing protein
MKPPFPHDEPARLAALRACNVLDTEREDGFDQLTLLAANLCHAPIALISLVDEHRQWFKSAVGISAKEHPRDMAFCAHAILERGFTVVPDAAADPRFATNPLVTGEPHIRFYAGAPLVTSEGHALGTLCVIDTVPRTLSPSELAALSLLSKQVVAHLELRRAMSRLTAASAERDAALASLEESRQQLEQRVRQRTAELAAANASLQSEVADRLRTVESLRNSEERYRLLVELCPDAIFIHHDFRVIYANPACVRIIGAPDGAAILGQDALQWPLPQFRPVVRERLSKAVRTGTFTPLVEQQFTRYDGRVIDVEITSAIFPGGTKPTFQTVFRDITERKQAERRRQLLSSELDHRVKNNLAAVLSLADQTLDASPSLEAFRVAFAGRIHAMAQAHEALARSGWDGLDLGEDARLILAPYTLHNPDAVRFLGPQVLLPARTALPISMALHELATNAVKHGALSTPAGRVDLRWSQTDSRVTLHWSESGGPAVSPTRRAGTGTSLIQGLIGFELHGKVTTDYHPAGLRCTLEFPLPFSPREKVAAPPAG